MRRGLAIRESEALEYEICQCGFSLLSFVQARNLARMNDSQYDVSYSQYF